jgi:hypothetical protein
MLKASLNLDGNTQLFLYWCLMVPVYNSVVGKGIVVRNLMRGYGTAYLLYIAAVHTDLYCLRPTSDSDTP